MCKTQNILDASDLLPDYLGFIFYPQSPRYVGDSFILPELPEQIQKVGVFVNQNSDFILSKINIYKLNLIQLHGYESPGFCQQLKLQALKNASSFKIMKAFGMNENFDFSQIIDYEPFIDFILLDTKTPQFGGTGQSFDWQLLQNLKTQKPIFMSGGISLDNLDSLLTFINTTSLNIVAIDVNSRFEVSPGLKDIEKLKTLTNKVNHCKSVC